MRRRRRGAAGGGGALAGVALGLAALALALTLALAVVCARGPRELPDETPDDPSLELAPPQPRSPREPHPPPMEQAGARRHRRTATKGKRLRPRKSAPTPLYAAHYEVQPADGQTGIYTAGPDGTIRGWAESRLNASSPLRYDEARGVFTVTHGGLYYVYAQVSSRSRRQLERPSPSPDLRHQHRQRTALHLVPSHCSTNGIGGPDTRFSRSVWGYRRSDTWVIWGGKWDMGGPDAWVPRGPRTWALGGDRSAGPLDAGAERSPRSRGRRHRAVVGAGAEAGPWPGAERLHRHCAPGGPLPRLQPGRAPTPRAPPPRTPPPPFTISPPGQVLFHDPTFTMGQVLWRLPPGGRGPGQILLRCVQSMPGQREQAYNSCYSGGAFHLQRGEGLRLAVPRANASLDLTPHGTFLGLVRL